MVEGRPRYELRGKILASDKLWWLTFVYGGSYGVLGGFPMGIVVCLLRRRYVCGDGEVEFGLTMSCLFMQGWGECVHVSRKTVKDRHLSELRRGEQERVSHMVGDVLLCAFLLGICGLC